MPEITDRPYIPEYITVHLGAPDTPAQNVTVPFIDYIKNVASSEIYPTWSTSAIRANVLAQVSYALNRVYLEYYRSRGYDFEITNSTAIDQSFVYGRNTFESIDMIVNEIFDMYIRREGFIEPLAAKYCDGRTTYCDGLSQWGSENLASQGYNSIEILKYYYGDDIEIVADAPVRPVTDSYPGYPLRPGSTGDYVIQIQSSLNRISRNYPGIPLIEDEPGVFGEDTGEAVRAFQRIFNLTVDGIVGNATWYKIVLVYTGVTGLAELDSEGQQYVLNASQVQSDIFLAPGSSGDTVETLQYYLNVLAQFYSTIPSVIQTGIYDSLTENSVLQAQGQFGLPQTGTVDYATWNVLEGAVAGIGNAVNDTQNG